MSAANEQAEFMKGLAEALNSKEIALPSFPDVVVKIRTALEDPTCSADRLAEVAKADPVLVSRLLRSVNSAFHNRAGIEIVDLDLAISRLGFETVRNTAITLAVEQIFDASQHASLTESLRQLWRHSVNLSALCYVLAQRAGNLNSDNAFLCGLLNNVGKLYILMKAQDFPAFLGDETSLEKVLADWSPSIGKSIVEAWGFPDEISATVDTSNAESGSANAQPVMADIVTAARLLADDPDGALADGATATLLSRLGISAENWPEIREPYETYVQSMRQSLSG